MWLATRQLISRRTTGDRWPRDGRRSGSAAEMPVGDIPFLVSDRQFASRRVPKVAVFSRIPAGPTAVPQPVPASGPSRSTHAHASAMKLDRAWPGVTLLAAIKIAFVPADLQSPTRMMNFPLDASVRTSSDRIKRWPPESLNGTDRPAWVPS